MASKPSFTDPQAAVQITRGGYSWASNLGQAVSLSFGFRMTAPPYSLAGSDAAGQSILPVTAGQAQALRTILANLSNVANLSFIDTGYSSNATLLFADYNKRLGYAAGFAYLPTSKNRTAASAEGDLYLNLGTDSEMANPSIGSYAWSTIVHETLHTLGLEHPGSYNAAPGTQLTYENNAEYLQDTGQYTIMSYFSEAKTGADWHGREAGTPMLVDILALQRLYGANPLAGLGDTVYGFNATAAPEYRLSSDRDTKVFCIYDPNGSNTLDFSGYSTNDIIDLRPGHFSSVGGLKDNVSIAYGSTIQTAIAGSGTCTLIASDVGCTLRGGPGRDTFLPGAGSDQIIGSGSGFSEARYEFSRSLAGLGGSPTQGITVRNDLTGTDTLTGLSRIRFSDGFLALDMTSAWTDDAYRLYGGTFARTPDYDGLLYWSRVLDQGTSLPQVAAAFVRSPEFTARYSPSQSPADFIDLLYRNTLGRTPDDTGRTYWLDLLTQGRLDRSDLLLGFTQSGEFITRTTADTAHGFFCV